MVDESQDMPIQPTPTSLKWELAEGTMADGSTQVFVSLRFNTALGTQTYFFPLENMEGIANGLMALCEEARARMGPQLMVARADIPINKLMNGHSHGPA